MTIVAVASTYDERATCSREIDPKLELDDQTILELMAESMGSDEPLDSCVLIRVEDDGSTFIDELVQ